MKEFKIEKIEGSTVCIGGFRIKQIDFKEFIILLCDETTIDRKSLVEIKTAVDNLFSVIKTKKKVLLLPDKIKVCRFTKKGK